MAIDLQVRVPNRPGTLLQVADALGRGGVNIEGACGYEVGEEGLLHVLVVDAERGRRTLLNAGVEIEAERQVVVVDVQNRPGGGAALLRLVADAGVNIDLLYTTLDGRLVLGSDEHARLRTALAAAGKA
ncbi:MAG TPA: hypothetical protein VIR16_06495 [Candidatus Limnocylindrales bacterium]